MSQQTPSDDRHAQESRAVVPQHTTGESDEVMEQNEQYSDDDYFDPDVSCDETERRMIAMMRALLRPDCAPECVYEKIRKTLDQCCEEGDCNCHKRVITKLTATTSNTATAAMISQTTIVTEHWDHGFRH